MTKTIPTRTNPIQVQELYERIVNQNFAVACDLTTGRQTLEEEIVVASNLCHKDSMRAPGNIIIVRDNGKLYDMVMDMILVEGEVEDTTNLKFTDAQLLGMSQRHFVYTTTSDWLPKNQLIVGLQGEGLEYLMAFKDGQMQVDIATATRPRYFRGDVQSLKLVTVKHQ